ncbi:armadillo-type protein [Epithele typhae]|uniref:armadillo-type protein n=1 Tax=Epithele typhae TaxID=378194 RepID=UPI0020079B97|nr:armadillo-type protein [Epithele typhae]KAH9945049.1 armadillo-type protein [Epithele typhae]
MFKSILPSRRAPSSTTEFQMLTSPVDSTDSEPNGKENYFANNGSSYDLNAKPKTTKHKKMKSKGQPEIQAPLSNQDFDRLLDDLQIPDTLRPKLATMDASVKMAFLKSSQVLALKPAPAAAPLTPRSLRRAQSSESVLSSPRPLKSGLESYDLPGRSQSSFGTGHLRGMSMDVRGQPLDSRAAPVAPLKVTKDKKKAGSTPAPEKYVSMLLGQSSTAMDVEVVKKLRLLLRNESASWTDDFVQNGGYDALLTRLNEILEVEWREEQHDDQMLYELLRCVKALSTSAVGCNALRLACPQPFDKLVSLLYSDKKPGDVPTRQLIVELLLFLFDLYPPSSLPSVGSPAPGHSRSRSRSVPWELSEGMRSTGNLVVLPHPHSTVFAFVKSLLLTPAPPPSEAPGTPLEPHAFIEDLRRPRIYKTYLQELSDICRDYFWVFCHPSNTIWELNETDEAKVEKPRAPGGMTGGVEYEAMCYMTMHFKFINAIAVCTQALNLPKEHENSAFRFHQDMLQSGIERIISVARKASTTYYPTLHLELARYMHAAGLSGVDIPWTLSRMLGQPPAGVRRPTPPVIPAAATQNTPTTPTKQRTAPAPGFAGYPAYPALPSGRQSGEQSRKVTPMFN